MTLDILVIDDDARMCDLIRAILEDDGYVVQTAADGGALRVAHTDPPHLIFLDLMMPVMDGYEMAHHLRADPATAAIPIVIMSAGGQAKAGAEQLGAVGYLPKPFDIDQLSAFAATYAPHAL